MPIIKVAKEKKAVQYKIRPELHDQVNEIAAKLGVSKSQVIQLAIGEAAYKILHKLPEYEAQGHMDHYDPESLFDIITKGKITGHMNYSALGFYLDIDLPQVEKGD